MSSEDSADASASSPQLFQGDALREALQHQCEYYFSRENLPRDAYLQSRMDKDRWVGVDVIAGFNLVKTLTEDEDMILSVLKDSKVVNVDIDRRLLQPAQKFERNTIIVRETPADVSEGEIRALFKVNECGVIKDIHSDIGNNWFVTLESETFARKALFSLLSETNLRGQPVHARLKAEVMGLQSGNRGNSNVGYRGPVRLGGIAPGYMYGAVPETMGRGMSPGVWVPGVAYGTNDRGGRGGGYMTYPSNRGGKGRGGINTNNTASATNTGHINSSLRGGRKGGGLNQPKTVTSDEAKISINSNNNNSNNNVNTNNINNNNNNNNSNNNNNNDSNSNNNNNNNIPSNENSMIPKTKNKKKKKKAVSGDNVTVDSSNPNSLEGPRESVSLGPQNFPPLPGKDGIPYTIGYTGEYKLYGQKEFLSIFSSIRTKERDGTIKPMDVPAGFDDPDCFVAAAEPRISLEISKDWPVDSDEFYMSLGVGKHHLVYEIDEIKPMVILEPNPVLVTDPITGKPIVNQSPLAKARAETKVSSLDVLNLPSGSTVSTSELKQDSANVLNNASLDESKTSSCLTTAALPKGLDTPNNAWAKNSSAAAVIAAKSQDPSQKK